MANPTRVAVGVIFNSQGKILVSLRPPHKLQGGFWEFPGGKIEPNETAEQALKRELLEEVDITIVSVKPLVICHYAYEYHTVQLEVFQVGEFSGIAYGKEGQVINWVTLQELAQLPLLSANHPIVEAIAKICHNSTHFS